MAEITEAMLEEWERLDREATPGPWRLHERGRTILTSQSHPLADLSDPEHRQMLDGRGLIVTGMDGEFIVAARSVLPDLLAEVRRLRAARPAQEERLRPEVLAFARVMEGKLAANEHKGGWDDERAEYLLRRMNEERHELTQAIDRWEVAILRNRRDDEKAKATEAVLSEAADVANFAMMIADVVHGLEAPAPASGTTETEPIWTTAECPTCGTEIEGIRVLPGSAFPATPTTETGARDPDARVKKGFRLGVEAAARWIEGQNTAPHFTAQLRYTLAEAIRALAFPGERGDATRKPELCAVCGQAMDPGQLRASMRGGRLAHYGCIVHAPSALPYALTPTGPALTAPGAETRDPNRRYTAEEYLDLPVALREQVPLSLRPTLFGGAPGAETHTEGGAGPELVTCAGVPVPHLRSALCVDPVSAPRPGNATTKAKEDDRG